MRIFGDEKKDQALRVRIFGHEKKDGGIRVDDGSMNQIVRFDPVEFRNLICFPCVSDLGEMDET